MDIKNEIALQLNAYLKGQKKKTIALEELTSLFSGDVSYVYFADSINDLIESEVLTPIKSAGISARTPRLPCKYKFDSSIIREEYKSDIERMAIKLHHKINLEYYFSQPQSIWEADKEDILKINCYLHKNGIPQHAAGSSERSYQIFGDEKFIDEKFGRRLLQRVRLYEDLKISSGFDPAMFFINSKKIKEDPNIHTHLIIENRAPFYSLSQAVSGSTLTSLIYGAGFNILASITMFEKQIDLPNAEHQYFYFGDLDYSGVSIWHYTAEKISVKPALPFYKALLNHEAAFGKEYQQPNMVALNSFLSCFSKDESETIRSMLSNGKYYPQEALVKKELNEIFLSCFAEESSYGN